MRACLSVTVHGSKGAIPQGVCCHGGAGAEKIFVGRSTCSLGRELVKTNSSVFIVVGTKQSTSPFGPR